MKKYLAVDLGGTAIKYGVITEDLQTEYEGHENKYAVNYEQQEIPEAIYKTGQISGNQPVVSNVKTIENILNKTIQMTKTKNEEESYIYNYVKQSLIFFY